MKTSHPQDKNLTKEIDGFDENLTPIKTKVTKEKYPRFF